MPLPGRRPSRGRHGTRFLSFAGPGQMPGWQKTSSKQKFSPAKVPEGCPARQVRFMSTQKRVNPDTPATKLCRRGRRYRSQPIKCTDRAGVGCVPFPAQIARYVCAAAKGETAPLLSILWSAMAWVATKFLHSDHHKRQLVRPVLAADRRGSPPPRVRSRAALGKQASPRSSLPHITYPAGFASIHRTLPQGATGPHGPIGPQSWDVRRGGLRAERYDGKRDMYFQHAA